jgi:uncharacterized protein
LIDSMNLTEREMTIVQSNDICRISTVSQNGWPHVVPVAYVFLEGRFYVPARFNSRKVRNVRLNPKATLVIDDEKPNVVL